MYKTKDLPKEQLKQIGITNQKEIKELTGSPLNLVKAWEVIRNNSSHFEKADEKALEADKLLYEIYQNGTKNKKPKTTSKELLRIQEQERARSLALLELELQIAA